MYYNLNKIKMKKAGRIISLCMAMATSFTPVMAQQGPKPESSLNNPLALTLVVIIAALALVIGMLAYVVYGAAEIELKKQQKQKADSSAKNIALTIALFLITATFANAQNTSEPVAQTTIGGLSSSVFYILLAILLIEITAIFFLLFQLRFLIGIERRKIVENEEKQTSIAREPVEIKLNWWDRFNKFRPVEQEANIDLGHNYDGIRELDNRLPPWWLYGFYITIIFAAVYLYRTHISHAAPSSAEEYQAAVTKANAQMEGRLKDQKNRVDENTVVLLTEKTELEKGKAVFASYCIACHGQLAQGTVGPNLTDDYWIHGGNIKDIFKTIKYGYPEKSMQSWKDQLTPVQIAQVSSYIKSLRGSNPAGAKEKQGELYEEK
ncbi:MAG TPA: cbb3-type cytochrome c oxidase N-terminal domain-containing protein [Chitinophagaceae bacterium]|nr:cbb3-type cytochrome c oxidase N-terminal domain-containing protein [Chitinophagaceae bacterium]